MTRSRDEINAFKNMVPQLQLLYLPYNNAIALPTVQSDPNTRIQSCSCPVKSTVRAIGYMLLGQALWRLYNTLDPARQDLGAKIDQRTIL